MRLWLRKAALDLGWSRVGRGPGIGDSRSAVCIEVLSIDEGVGDRRCLIGLEGSPGSGSPSWGLSKLVGKHEGQVRPSPHPLLHHLAQGSAMQLDRQRPMPLLQEISA